MRLIHTRSLQLESFATSCTLPYAILSHTWGDDEVSFEDMHATERTTKKGWTKIVATCQQALEAGIEYAWIDTCCIDKTSSAELTEAINSMYNWYANAEVCYVYLSDLPYGSNLEIELPKCRWWTRGWTLQELLAPTSVLFYDDCWNFVGSKQTFSSTISRCTGVPEDAISDYSRTSQHVKYSVAARLSWAGDRLTTRVEDLAYCLIGLFDVNMPLLYGEGRQRSFRRLQEEIAKRDNDLTLLAFSKDFLSSNGDYFVSILAEGLADFRASGHLQRFPHTLLDFAMTNRGLKFTGQMPLRLCGVRGKMTATEMKCLVLLLGHLGRESDAWGICLRKIGLRVLQRDSRFDLIAFHDQNVKHIDSLTATDVYVLIDPPPNVSKLYNDFRKDAIAVPGHAVFSLYDVIPENLWDFTERVFLKPRPNVWVRFENVLALHFKAPAPLSINVLVLCDYRSQPPKARVVERQNPDCNAGGILFQDRCREESMSWTDLELFVPSVKALTNSVVIDTPSGAVTVTVTFRVTTRINRQYHMIIDVSRNSTHEAVLGPN